MKNENEVWDVSDRHGEMTIKLMQKVNDKKDMFFEAIILLGNKDFLSESYKEDQKESGLGTAGHKSSFRTGLCRFIRRRKDMEN